MPWNISLYDFLDHTADDLMHGERAWPVGSVYINADVPTNPADLFGFGTWELFGQGKVPVGLDSGDVNFDTLGETGGASTVTLAIAQMPGHGHTQNSHNHTQSSHNHTQNSHGHTQNAHNHTQSAHAHTMNSKGLHSHAIRKSTTFATGVGRAGPRQGAGSEWSGGDPVKSSGYHTHTIYSQTPSIGNKTATNQTTAAVNQAATAVNQATTASNNETGGDGSHNNLQPYVVVYMWRRVA